MSAAEDATALLRGSRTPEVYPPSENPDRGMAAGSSVDPKPSAPESTTASSVLKEEPGVAQMPEGDLIPSGEALQLLQDKDPLNLTDRDLDQIIAYNRDHRRRLEAGTLKKGQRPTPRKKAPAKKKPDAQADTSQEED